MNNELIGLCEILRDKKPIVHHITNYVTVNDCANITLAIGGSPIMADSIEEVEDIVDISSSLVINIGTLNKNTLESIIMAGKAANKKGIPVIFDPVGVGASHLRNMATKRIMDNIKLTVLRGNISEIRYISGLSSTTKGVDASESDIDSDAKDTAEALARKIDCVVAITGAIDVISDGEKTIFIENGHSTLSKITGTGCMCSSLIGSFCGAVVDKPFYAAVSALLCMGISGERAYEKAGHLGNGSYHMALMDAISLIDSKILEKRAKQYEA